MGTEHTPAQLLDLWNHWSELDTWQRVRGDAFRRGDVAGVAVADGALDSVQPVTPLEALEANVELVKLLTGWRWQAIRAAREQGATWQDVGDALGVSRQAAWETYKAAVERQAEHDIPGFDEARARAVLDEE